MIQTGVIEAAHGDLITDAVYDYYGLKLATCSLDQRIKIWALDEAANVWNLEDEWRAHDAAVSKVSWAHPEFGSILASASFDRTVKVWEMASDVHQQPESQTGQPPTANAGQTAKWHERSILHDSRGTVRSVEFCPHHFGLKLATISTDNVLRIYECVDILPKLGNWNLVEEIDVDILSPSLGTNTGSVNTTPTHTQPGIASDIAGSGAHLVNQALQQQQAQQQLQQQAKGSANREADGGWCLSWCKDRYWGEIIVVGCGVSGVVKILNFTPSQHPTLLLTLNPYPHSLHPASHSEMGADHSDGSVLPVAYSITTVSWAPSCGRSYHLIATGGRDGHVRIWKVVPPKDAESLQAEEGLLDDGFNTSGMMPGASSTGDDPNNKWAATIVADFDHHKSIVGRVEWNLTGTTLSSSGNDGRIRLWKATASNVWRAAGSIDVEQVDQPGTGESAGDVMEE